MAKLIRLPLLVVLGVVTAVLVFTTPAYAGGPVCTNQGGHFSDNSDIVGWCNGFAWGRQGHMHHEWDCVQASDGSYYPTNIVTTGPFWCGAPPPYATCC